MLEKINRHEPLFIRFCWHFYRFVLSRRYKLVIKGIEHLETKGGKVLFPNHQSHIDPQLLALLAFKYTPIIPVVAEPFFKIPVVKYFLKKWDAVSVSNLRKFNRDVNILERLNKEIHENIKNGKMVIIYPAGQLCDQGIEKIYNKQAAHALMQNFPEDAKVIGLRIHGLWGSMWSRAWMGERPNFLYTYMKAIFYVFANLIFFVPKRTVSLEFIDITEDAKTAAKGDRQAFNTYMENFLNVNGREEPSFIKHFFYAPKPNRKLPENLQKLIKQ